jgi:general stress protein YciG
MVFSAALIAGRRFQPAAQNLIIAGVGMSADHLDPRDNAQDDSDEAPEVPLDEPRPPRVQDPPSERDPKGPYTVHPAQMNGGGAVSTERKERRGFASMSPEKQREIASKGGRAAHEKGTAHEWTADEARNAGRKGGQVSRGGRGRLIIPPDAQPPAGAADAVQAQSSAGSRAE